ncbi:hypothetical protein IG631_23877 [Alternaria alternata]|nr:hypothetical protein IG631_23877 [Alternaria alternata]
MSIFACDPRLPMTSDLGSSLRIIKQPIVLLASQNRMIMNDGLIWGSTAHFPLRIVGAWMVCCIFHVVLHMLDSSCFARACLALDTSAPPTTKQFYKYRFWTHMTKLVVRLDLSNLLWIQPYPPSSVRDKLLPGEHWNSENHVSWVANAEPTTRRPPPKRY